MTGGRAMNVSVVSLAAISLLAAGCSAARESATSDRLSTLAHAVSSGQAEAGGFYGGRDVLFTGTAPSDYEVAALFPRMVGLQAVLVPSLGLAPEAALAGVYVFANGVEGGGPLGFQADVFDSVPGEHGYSPLRAVVLVIWSETATPRVLRSVEQIDAAEASREVALGRPGVVAHLTVLSRAQALRETGDPGP